MRKIQIAALVSAAVSFGIALSAQAPRDVTLTIAATPVPAGRTASVHVTIQIPDGRFIPAETRGDLKGAWLQSAGSPFLDRELANFPIPGLVTLAGADRPILAYTGTIAVRVPLETPYPTRPRNLELQLGYQLCDARTCDPFRTLTAGTRVSIVEPPVTAGFVAVRTGSSRIAIISDRKDPFDRALSFQPVSVRFVMPMATVPEGHPSRGHFDGNFAVGSHWTVTSTSHAFTAIADQPAVLNGGCEDIMPLVLNADVSDPSFASERTKFFLAMRAEESAPAASPKSAGTAFKLSENQQRDLDSLLNRLMRITVPTVYAAPPEHTFRPLSPSEQRHLDAIVDGTGRLVTHVEAFTLAPDGDPRLYVRAYWAKGGVARIGLTAWVRVSGSRLIVERSDASVSRFARYSEMKTFGPDVAAQPSFAGQLLNVVAAPDGWAFVIIGRSGYESMGVTVFKYSPDGPVETGISYSHGC